MNDRTFFGQAEDEDYFSQQPHSRLSIARYPDGSYHLHYACGASRHHYVYRFDEDTWEGVVDGLIHQALGDDVPINMLDVTTILATICQLASSGDSDDDDEKLA